MKVAVGLAVIIDCHRHRHPMMPPPPLLLLLQEDVPLSEFERTLHTVNGTQIRQGETPKTMSRAHQRKTTDALRWAIEVFRM